MVVTQVANFIDTLYNGLQRFANIDRFQPLRETVVDLVKGGGISFNPLQ